MSKMTKCKSCGADIASSAKRCPSCGAKNKKPIYKRVWLWILVVVLLIAIFGFITSKVNPSDSIEIETTTEADSNVYVKKSSTKKSLKTNKIISEFYDNTVLFKKNYDEQVVEWEGTITGIAETDDENKDVIVYMDKGIDTYLIEYIVSATIKNDKDKEKILNYKTGDKIKIKGIMSVSDYEGIDFFMLDYATIIG